MGLSFRSARSCAELEQGVRVLLTVVDASGQSVVRELVAPKCATASAPAAAAPASLPNTAMELGSHLPAWLVEALGLILLALAGIYGLTGWRHASDGLRREPAEQNQPPRHWS